MYGLRQDRARQSNASGGQGAERQSWARAGSRQGQNRLEQSPGIARAQPRVIFGVIDQQGRDRVRVMEVAGQDQGGPRTGRARTGLFCPGKEWPKRGQKNMDRPKSGKTRTGSGQEQAG